MPDVKLKSQLAYRGAEGSREDFCSVGRPDLTPGSAGIANMGDSAALRQLLDMGIPRGRAMAALIKAKDDVATAAERVFGGEHDDIPSDDEGTASCSNGDKRLVVASDRAATVTHIPAATLSESDDFSDDGSFGDPDMDGDDGEFEGFSDGLDFDDAEVDMEANRLLSDPYAGVFFSKERAETIIENAEPEDWATIHDGALAGTKVRLLTAGEWMSGCPEGNEQSFLFQLYNKLAMDDLECSAQCGHVYKRSKADFFAVFTDFQAYVQHLCERIHYSCPKCSAVTCLACGEKGEASGRRVQWSGIATSSCLGEPKGKSKAVTGALGDYKEEPILLHCVDLQGAIIGMGLQIIEHAFRSSTSRNSSARVSPPAKRLRNNTGSNSGGAIKKAVSGMSKKMAAGVGALDSDDEDEGEDEDAAYVTAGRRSGSKAAKGTGYAGAGKEDTSGQKAAAKAEKERDAKTAALLRQVKVYLPQFDRRSGPTTSDHLVHPTTLAHLRRRSAFVNDLLRNDSLLDMSNRSELYTALFDWLQIISNHEALASMLAMPQMRPAKTAPVADSDDLVEVTYEGSSSPRELLENIVIQAQAALKGLNSGVKAEDKFEGLTKEDMNRLTKEQLDKMRKEEKARRGDDANESLSAFCEKIISSSLAIDRSLTETKGAAFVQRMHESLPRLPDAKGGELDKEARAGLSTASKAAVIKICKVRFQYADLRVPGAQNKFMHAFQADLAAIEAQRSLAIAKELAILTTNLPVAWHSTIFLRVDEERVDCIKAMIIGPEGTPYENGCFIFDIFLPLEYNQVCPKVKTMTTNGGKYRYNPNLYAEGKVCLSLLGTWAGPGWIPGQSTLLQVLISIQSLIMCEEPYLNEPGWANDGGSAQSKAYSANVRRMVIHDAMGNNIRRPPKPFANEIRTHFRLKAQAIREQLDKWQALDNGGSTDGHNMGSGHWATAAAKTNASGNGVAAARTEVAATDFARKANELRELLDDLESGKIDGTDDVA